MQKTMSGLRDVLGEMRLMMDIKGDESPSDDWQREYDFLERYSRHLREKIHSIQGDELDSILNGKRAARIEREEEEREEERKENAWKTITGRGGK